ncbi:hypothetical protein V5T82_00970 [Magnetovibrio sp. PR-2]|uniref:hypothetical protein n=1 Tax=Magnetovibrio sp. PR-2 TaxID=3120356 RepID=UPI002FCE0541
MTADTRSTFWLLYVLYGAEVLHIALLLSGFLAQGFYDTGAGTGLLYILPAPVLIGFWTRHYFVRGIWLAYAWIVGLGYASSDVGGDLLSIDWANAWPFVLYPIILSLILVGHKSSPTYFHRTMFARTLQEVESQAVEGQEVFQKGQKLDPDAFLAMRLAKAEQKQSRRPAPGLGWAQAFWTGGYIALAGYVLDVALIWEFGLMILVMGFVLGRIWLAAARRG